MDTRYNLVELRNPRASTTDGKVMVTVLVEKREFGGKPGSAGRPRRDVKPAAKPIASQSPAPTAPAADSRSGDSLSPSDRYRLISVFAYYKAEKRGFAPGHMWDDWLAAEREINARSSSGSVQAADPNRSGGS